jgi:hypothetical protein
MTNMLANNHHRDVSLSAQSSTPIEQQTEILFIDSRIEDYQSLIAYVTAGTQETEVIILDPTLNKIEQILQALVSRSDIKEVHIVSPGEDESFHLLSTQLNADNKYGYRSQLQQLMEQSDDDYTLDSDQAYDASLWDAYYLCSI